MEHPRAAFTGHGGGKRGNPGGVANTAPRAAVAKERPNRKRQWGGFVPRGPRRRMPMKPEQAGGTPQHRRGTARGICLPRGGPWPRMAALRGAYLLIIKRGALHIRPSMYETWYEGFG